MVIMKFVERLTKIEFMQRIAIKTTQTVNQFVPPVTIYRKIWNSKLSKIPGVIESILSGNEVNYSSIIAYPKIMFKIIQDLNHKLVKLPHTKFEIELLQSYRKAEAYYSSEIHKETKVVNLTAPIKNKVSYIPPTERNPQIISKNIEFPNTFLMKHVKGQLDNFSRGANHHVYDEVDKRYWFTGRFFSGKQFFERMGGKRNTDKPCNWRNNLQYNIIMPSLSTLKNWSPKGCIGFCPYFKYIFNSLTPTSCKNVCITIDGMKVLKKIENMSGIIVGTNVEIKNEQDIANVKLDSLIIRRQRKK